MQFPADLLEIRYIFNSVSLNVIACFVVVVAHSWINNA